MEKNVGNFLNEVREIYASLQDEDSRGIFKELLLYHTTDNGAKGLLPYLSESILNKMREFDAAVTALDLNQPLVIYGAGGGGRYVLDLVKERLDITQIPIFFCDQAFETLQNVNGVKVISPKELITTYPKATIFISSTVSFFEIRDFLLSQQIPNENILSGVFVDEENQYFDPIMQFGEHEIFLDVGACNGNTSVEFAKRVNGKYDKIYLFEPEASNLEIIAENTFVQDLIAKEIVPLGAWHQKEVLSFVTGFSGACKISDSGTVEIPCDSMDHILKDVPVTFIKMDIEGAELNALKGAKEMILKYKPKLAISVYHKPEDIIEIPAFIKSLVPEYQLYMRHYCSFYAETILYAFIP